MMNAPTPHPPPHMMGMGGGGRVVPRATHTVLLTHVPPALHGARPLRAFLGACGLPRVFHFVPAMTSGNDDDKMKKEETLSPTTAVVTVSHTDVAIKIVAAVKHIATLLGARDNQKANDNDDDNKKLVSMQAFLVPTHPDIPLPPATLDPTTTTALAEKLIAAYQQQVLPNSSTNNNMPVMMNHHANNPNTTTTTTPAKPSNLVAEPIDEDVDPLEIPAVREAVRAFRQRLETQQGSKATRRQALVARKLAESLPMVRQRMQDEQTQPAPPANLPPPLPSGLPPPLPSGLPPMPPLPTEGMAATAAAPRGVSNLPAWMTAPGAAATAATDTAQEPALKKRKLDLTAPFAPLPASAHAALTAYIQKAVADALGQEDATLQAFVFQHVVDQAKPAQALLGDLKEVLEDEADGFLQALMEQVDVLASST